MLLLSPPLQRQAVWCLLQRGAHFSLWEPCLLHGECAWI